MKVELYSLYEDERPLKGSVGLLDWRLKGVISRYLTQGHITGRLHELTYVPFSFKKNLRHILLVGLGSKKNSHTLKENQNEFFQKISTTLKKLNCDEVILSQDGFEFLDLKKIKSEFTPIRMELMEFHEQ